MNYLLSHGIDPYGEISLPASKSISNRLLIIRALCDSPFMIENIAACDDTSVLSQALFLDTPVINVGMAGTAMRFLTPLLAITPGTHTLTGAPRMLQRPIEPLVQTLKKMGANISYAGQETYPPLVITGAELQGGYIEIDADISSQFITAIMMVAPYFKNPTEIRLKGHIASLPYVQLTAALMQQYGNAVSMKENTIYVPLQHYKPHTTNVEADWSSAAYWYSYMALRQNGSIKFPNLNPHSLQGDAIAASLFESFGINTLFKEQSILIDFRPNDTLQSLELDCNNFPDLVPTLAVTACFRNIPFSFNNVQSLRIKETDRIEALCNELRKCGYILSTPDTTRLEWNGHKEAAQEHISICTYGDHRMAMAFAPIVAHKNIEIQDIDVVSKSYPDFWKNLHQFCNIEIEK